MCDHSLAIKIVKRLKNKKIKNVILTVVGSTRIPTQTVHTINSPTSLASEDSVCVEKHICWLEECTRLLIRSSSSDSDTKSGAVGFCLGSNTAIVGGALCGAASIVGAEICGRRRGCGCCGGKMKRRTGSSDAIVRAGCRIGGCGCGMMNHRIGSWPNMWWARVHVHQSVSCGGCGWRGCCVWCVPACRTLIPRRVEPESHQPSTLLMVS